MMMMAILMDTKKPPVQIDSVVLSSYRDGKGMLDDHILNDLSGMVL